MRHSMIVAIGILMITSLCWAQAQPGEPVRVSDQEVGQAGTPAPAGEITNAIPPPPAVAQAPVVTTPPAVAPPQTTASEKPYVKRDDLEKLPARVADLEKRWRSESTAAAKGGRTALAHRQQASLLAIQISGLRAQIRRLEASSAGGPAAKWAAPQVADVLQRGAANGGLVGRRPGATPQDVEWKKAASRQELAVVTARLTSYAEENATVTAKEAIRVHNEDPEAHPLLQQAIAGEAALRQRSACWLWVAVIVAGIIGLIGWFLPRLRAAVAPEPEEEEVEEEPEVPEGGEPALVPAPAGPPTVPPDQPPAPAAPPAAPPAGTPAPEEGACPAEE